MAEQPDFIPDEKTPDFIPDEPDSKGGGAPKDESTLTRFARGAGLPTSVGEYAKTVGESLVPAAGAINTARSITAIPEAAQYWGDMARHPSKILSTLSTIKPELAGLATQSAAAMATPSAEETVPAAARGTGHLLEFAGDAVSHPMLTAGKVLKGAGEMARRAGGEEVPEPIKTAKVPRLNWSTAKNTARERRIAEKEAQPNEAARIIQPGKASESGVVKIGQNYENQRPNAGAYALMTNERLQQLAAAGDLGAQQAMVRLRGIQAPGAPVSYAHVPLPKN